MRAQQEAAHVSPLTPFEQLRLGRDIVRTEARGLESLSGRLDAGFCEAVRLIFDCRGSVIVTGMGKAGLVGQKIAATLASTGTRAHFLHPAEAVHGDLGRINGDDVVLALSYSGQTEEVLRLLPTLRRLDVPLVAVTSKEHSTLARFSDVVVVLGRLEEACPLGLAPSTSTTAMLALGDALALVVSHMRGFGREQFALFHPAGSLGRQLMRVEDVMRTGEALRIAPASQTVREVFVAASHPGRRTGAIMLVDDAGRLAGIFTDSDLARLFESRRDQALDGPIADVMVREPRTVALGAWATEAVAILAGHKISELPVIDSERRPVGLIDITDVVALLPEDALP